MIVNNHRKHSSFAIEHFLAGGCHTPDAAYCLLYAQMEQIEMDCAAGDAAVLSQKAEKLALEKRIEEAKENGDEIEELRARAELIRANAALKNFKLNFQGAQRELQELQAALDRLKPMCKYWNEDILQMEQDMQRDEWVGELKNRAENMLLSNAMGIPYDHLATMRQHPDFFEKILPHVEHTHKTIAQLRTTGDHSLIASSLTAPFKLPPALTHQPEEKEKE